MKKLSTLRAAAFALTAAALSTFDASAQLLQQDFSSSATVASYVSATPSNGQWTAISSSGGGTVLSINTTGSNKLRFDRTGNGNAGAFTRTTDFSPAPTSMMYRFDLTLSGTGGAVTSAAVFQVGAGFTNSNGAEANAAVHSRFSLNTTATAGQFVVRDIAGSANGANTYSGTQTITWVINNSGGAMTYRAPDGSNESIANDTWDLWVGTTKEFNDRAATSAAIALTDLKFALTGSTAIVDMDNFLIDAIPAIPTSSAALPINANDFQANWSTIAGVTGYSIDVATDAGFTSFVSGYNNLYVAGQATTSVSVTGLAPSTPYWYRVRGTSVYTVGSFSGGNSGTQNPTTISGTSTSVQFNATSSSASENAGSIGLGLGITNYDVTNPTSVTISATGATGRISSFTTPVIFPANNGSTQTCTVVFNNDLLCNGDQNVVFTITGISGGQGTPTIGANNTFTLTVLDNDVCTNVSFATTSATVSEGVGTYNVTVNITNPSGSQATGVDVALASGNAARINGFSSQSISFPAGSSTPINVTITVTDNAVCGDGDEVLTFGLENLTGGQGTPTVGPARTLTVQNNDNPADPVTNTASPINYYDFTALWNTVSGASYFLDVSLYSDFFTPGTTNLVEWNFPAATNDNIADGGIAVNSAKTLTSVGANAAAYNSAGNGGLTARADGWNGGNGTKYWQVEMVTTGYGDLKVSSKQRSSGTGPRDFKLQYKIGVGGTWTDVSGGAVVVADNYTTGVLNALALPTACDNQASVFLRWIMTSNEDSQAGVGNVAAGGASNIDDVVIIGRVPSYVSGYQNLPVAGTSQSVTGLTQMTTYYYRVRSTGGCSTGNNSNVTTVTTTPVPTYYSRNTGNVTDAIWSDTPGGAAGSATWTSGSNMVVQSGDVVTNTANVQLKDLTVDAGGALVLDAFTFSVNGTTAAINGTLTANDNSNFALVGNAATAFTTVGTPSFYDITVTNLGGVTATGNIDVRGTLQLNYGNFNAMTALVVLRGTATETGRLGPVNVTASYTGDLKIERYRPAGLTNWLLMGSPIQGRTVLNWQDDFITAGYPGSQFPAWPTAADPWPSIRWYDETDTGTGQNDGLQGVSSNGQALSVGQGFAVWAGSGLTNTTAFTVDLGGASPFVAQTPVSLPVTYTTTGNPTVDGWNLVSNPLPSAIDFETMSLGTSMSPSITYYNPANGNTAAYNRNLNVGTNNATNVIQSMQGFFLKAVNNADATASVEEADKIDDNSGGMFGLDGEQPALLRVRISSGINTFSDEAVILFSAGAPALDADDVEKFVLAHDAAPQIASVAGAQQLAINAFGSADAGVSIPMSINVGVTGDYTISAIEVGGLELSCLSIEDLVTGITASLEDGAVYTFTADANDDPSVARFVLHGNIGPDASFTADNTTVMTGVDVQFTSSMSAEAHTWDFGDGSTSNEVSPTHAWTLPGTYTVAHTVTTALCAGTSTTDITVELSTGIADGSRGQANAWTDGNSIVVMHAFTGSDAVVIDLLDATGRVVMQRRVGANTGRILLPTQDLGTGIWFVRMVQGATSTTLRVPVLR